MQLGNYTISLYPKKPDNLFKRDDYGKALENILRAAQEDYKQITYERRARQQFILRTYLWLSTLILGVQIPIFSHVKISSVGFKVVPWDIQITPFFYFWAAVAIFASLASFVLGVDTMRGRGETLVPYQPYKKLLDLAYKSASNTPENSSSDKEAWCIEMIKSLTAAINNERLQASKVGKKLRGISYAILISVLFTMLALMPTFKIDIQNGLPTEEVNKNAR